MTATDMRAIARNQLQARRDIQMRKMVLTRLDIQTVERGRGRRVRGFLGAMIVFAALYWLVTSVSDVGAYISLLHGNRVHLDTNNSEGLFIFPLTFPLTAVFFGEFLLFPRKYLYAGVDALLEAVASGDSLLMRHGALETDAAFAATFPASAEELGPFPRWAGKVMVDSREGGGRVLVVLGFVLAGFGMFFGVLGAILVSTPPAMSPDQPPAVLVLVFFLGIGLILIGMGVWLGLVGRRMLRESRWMRSDLTVLADSDGITWSDRAWRGREHLRMAWRDIRSFSVVTFRPSLYDDEYRVYILDGGRTRLLWALPNHPSEEVLGAHTRLATLVIGNAHVSLCDLTPGVVALDAALRSANPMSRTAEEKAFANAQPPIPGVPVDTMRWWYRTFLAIMGTATGISLIIGIADILVRWIA